MPNEGPEIRPADHGDVDALIAAYEWLFAPPGSRPSTWQEQRAAVALREAINSDDAAILIATDPRPPVQGTVPGTALSSGVLVGFITGYLDIHSVRFGLRCWVEDFAVDPEHRSYGVGGRLLTAMRGWARERGATHLELDSADSRLDAHRFYEREGADPGSRSFRWDPV